MEIVRLDVLVNRRLLRFAESARETPIKLPPQEQRDEVVLSLPVGTTLVERPAEVRLESNYGRFECSYAVNENKIKFCRSFSLHPVVVAPAEYAALKKFLADVVKASQANVLLRRE